MSFRPMASAPHPAHTTERHHSTSAEPILAKLSPRNEHGFPRFPRNSKKARTTCQSPTILHRHCPGAPQPLEASLTDQSGRRIKIRPRNSLA